MFSKAFARALAVPAVAGVLALVIYLVSGTPAPPGSQAIWSNTPTFHRLAGGVALLAGAVIAGVIVGVLGVIRIVRGAARDAARFPDACLRTYDFAARASFGLIVAQIVAVIGAPILLVGDMGELAFPLVLVMAAVLAVVFRRKFQGLHRIGLPSHREVTNVRARELGAWPALRSMVEQAVAPLHAAPPSHVVLTLAPNVSCTRETVVADGQVLKDGAVFLSLPLCRALETPELAALISCEVTRAYTVPPGWPSLIAAAAGRAVNVLDPPISTVFEAPFLPLRLATEAWTALDRSTVLGAVQRGAVVAGRENMASAIIKRLLYEEEWQPFVMQVETTVRRNAIGVARPSGRDADAAPDPENVSEMLAARLANLSETPAFRRTLQGVASGPVNSREMSSTLWLQAVGVRLADIEPRLGRVVADPAISVMDGADEIERALTAELVEGVRNSASAFRVRRP